MQTRTLRIPKGLWDDLEEVVILQDRQFLTDVARSLGLPVQDVLKKCLGTRPTLTSIPALWMTDEEPTRCPWWNLYGSLWRPCPRQRLSASLPCCKHERSTTTATQKIASDPSLASLTMRVPVLHEDALYWVDETGQPLHEDGRVVEDVTVRFTEFKGKRVAIWQRNRPTE